jgi:tetratricopeptide (TPR) repeat protein
VRSIDELTARLRLLRAWAGVGYHEIHRRIVDLRASRGLPEHLAYNTVYRCLQPGRSRLDVELVVDIVRVLVGDEAVAAWRLAFQVIASRASAAAIVYASAALPDDLAEFTGRREALDQVSHLAARTVGPDDPAPVVVIEGMAGVGKTTLAVHAAHRFVRQRRFDDLQLWVNLRGYDPAQPPADPSAVLEAFLRLLGVPGEQIYRLDLAGRSAKYRRLLAGRRALIALDNAATEEQVRPLLPDTPGCLTVVTTRHAMPTLAGASRLQLGVFPEPDALELLRRAIGPDRIDAAPGIAASIARSVGHLPLALRLVASRISETPGWTLADHLTRLAERREQRRLDTGVELALTLSYNALPPDGQQMVRLLSLHCGSDFDVYAAAALAGTDLNRVQRQLDDLTAANLLQQSRPARYHFHDLVSIYASACATDAEPEPARRDALTRLFDSYLFTASQAMDIAYAFERHVRPHIAAPSSPVPVLASAAEAQAWLAGEYPNLLASIIHAAQHGWPDHTYRFARTLSRWLHFSGRYNDALIVHGHALEAAMASGNRTTQGIALISIGSACHVLGLSAPAARYLQLALKICRETGDRNNEGWALGTLGVILASTGRYAEAVEHLLIAVDIYREFGDRSAEERASSNLGHVHALMGRYHDAIVHYEHALEVGRTIGDRAGEGLVLGNLAGTYAQLGRPQNARECYRQALTLHREAGHRAGEANVLSLTHAAGGLDNEQDIIDCQRQAATIAHEIGDPDLEAMILNRFGDALQAIGRSHDAYHQYASALTLARTAGEPQQEARAHEGIGNTMHTTGRPDHARSHWQDALAIYRRLEIPRADEVAAHLTALDRAESWAPRQRGGRR